MVDYHSFNIGFNVHIDGYSSFINCFPCFSIKIFSTLNVFNSFYIILTMLWVILIIKLLSICVFIFFLAGNEPAVNQNLVGTGYMSADQKKKLLWGSKKAAATEDVCINVLYSFFCCCISLLFYCIGRVF